jgi:hypothetical protein
MGDKAKPPGVGERRRLCCLRVARSFTARYSSGSGSRSCLRRSASFSHEQAIYSKIFSSTGVAAEFASSRHLSACVLYSAIMFS